MWKNKSQLRKKKKTALKLDPGYQQKQKKNQHKARIRVRVCTCWKLSWMKKKATLGHCRWPWSSSGYCSFHERNRRRGARTEVDRTWGGLWGGRQDLRPQKRLLEVRWGQGFHSQVITGHGEVGSEREPQHAHAHTDRKSTLVQGLSHLDQDKPDGIKWANFQGKDSERCSSTKSIYRNNFKCFKI